MATRTPSRASARAMACPMPRAPPVTTATLPLRERGVLDMSSIMAAHEQPIAQVEFSTGEKAGVAVRPYTGFQITGERAHAALTNRRIQLDERGNGLLGARVEIALGAPPVGAHEAVGAVV